LNKFSYYVRTCTGFSHLLYDWQTLVAGLLALISALIAGLLAYTAGSRQVAEIRRQNRFLQRSESRRLARTVVSSARILDGILKVADESIRSHRFGESLNTDIGMNTTNQIRQSIEVLPRYEMMEHLKNLGREIIDNYFLLCTKIADFRRQSGSSTAESLQREMEGLLKLLDHIRSEIAEEVTKSLAVLSHEDPEPDRSSSK
jgi:hypothetical protein